MTRTPIKLAAVGTACVILGAGASTILDASAAPTAKLPPRARTAAAAMQLKAHRRLLGRAVHAELTVPTKAGFKTVTIDRGTLTAIDGSRLSVDESTAKLPGRSVTLTLPAGARVRANRRAGTLADLKVGQRVAVAQLPRQTVVRAFDKRTTP